MRSAQSPLVTCAMVTNAAPVRAAYLKASVNDYLRQTYDRKELLVVAGNKDAQAIAALTGYIAKIDRPDIRLVEADHDFTLGRLRNLSFELARGDVVCQWDDDDRHHPERIASQLCALTEAEHEAVYLQDMLQYFPRDRRLYYTTWRATGERAAPGTLMAWRTTPIRYPEEGPESRLGEDSHVAFALNARGKVGHVREMGHLYVYVSHGANSWHDEHHHNLVGLLAITKGLLLRRETVIRQGLKPLDLGAYPITMWGNNGAAFELAAYAQL